MGVETKSEDPLFGDVELRGKRWALVDVEWEGADPSVGIMTEYPGNFDLEDEDGKRWDFDNQELTRDEEKLVDEALSKLNYEPPEPYDYD